MIALDREAGHRREHAGVGQRLECGERLVHQGLGPALGLFDAEEFDVARWAIFSGVFVGIEDIIGHLERESDGRSVHGQGGQLLGICVLRDASHTDSRSDQGTGLALMKSKKGLDIIDWACETDIRCLTSHHAVLPRCVTELGHQCGDLRWGKLGGGRKVRMGGLVWGGSRLD